MTPDLLWFVLAGFLLGFITSTLWEWFYFRRERLKRTDRRILELEDKLRRLENEPAAADEAADQPAWAERTYRSPGVFLDVEEQGVEEQGEESVADGADDAPRAPEEVAAPVAIPRAQEVEPAGAAKPLSARPMSARTRQEVLAALRRNSEAAGRRSMGAENAETPVPASAPAPVQTPAQTPPEPAAPVRAWQQDPALTQPSSDYPDNLSKIRGIGDVYRQRLYKAGIYTWDQVATADEETLRRATSAYPSSNVHEWPPQARELAEKNGRTGARYTGPTPDNLTKIFGIGPVSAQSLYRAGICTYEQLASTTPERLAELFPIAVAGELPDFAAWIRQATELADEKHSS